MGWFSCVRATGAIVLACCIAWLGPATSVAANPANELAVSKAEALEPFGLAASLLLDGGLRDKWLGLERELDDELRVLARCEENRATCESAAALQFLAIVDSAKSRDGRARLGEVNRAINLAIRPVSDLSQYGAPDVWSSPLATLGRGAGDCEDYAIAKLVALRRAGFPPEDLKLVILTDTLRGEDHALVAARLDGHWLMLDNRRMIMIEDVQLRDYRPIFVIDAAGVKRYRDPMPAPTDQQIVSAEHGDSWVEIVPM
jgi:predicted transglutaminase-like cysteine proteinase